MKRTNGGATSICDVARDLSLFVVVVGRSVVVKAMPKNHERHATRLIEAMQLGGEWRGGRC